MAEFLAQHSALIGLLLITLVFIAFVIERYPPEVVACCGAIAFLLCGYLDTRQISDDKSAAMVFRAQELEKLGKGESGPDKALLDKLRKNARIVRK